MKISIITPCFDRVTFLNETIESVLSQKGDFEIEYIVQFSGGNKEVDELLAYWEDKVQTLGFQLRCLRIDFKVYRELDTGMYDGLNRGFSKATGDIYAWINSDDIYHPGAFQTITKVFRENDSIHWISGIPNSFNAQGSRTGYDKFPRSYSRAFIGLGYYRIENFKYGFNWIAQDSCFWTTVLWNNSGCGLNGKLKFAADFELWQRFSRHADLVKVESFLGGYRFHGDQFTADPEAYSNELPIYNLPDIGYRRLIAICGRFPRFRSVIFNKYQGKPWLRLFNLNWSDLVGRTVEWSFENNKWNVYHHPIF